MFPITSTTPSYGEVVGTSAALMRIGTRVQDRTEAMQSVWSGLAQPGLYETPHTDRVVALMDPAVDAAADFMSGADTASTAVMSFAVEIFRVQEDLKDLEVRARMFRDSVVDGVVNEDNDGPRNPFPPDPVHWTEDGSAVEKNRALLSEYAAALVRVSHAADEAVSQIRAIAGMPYVREPEPWSVGVLMSMSMPWGTPRAYVPDPLEQFLAGAWGTVKSSGQELFKLVPFADGFGDLSGEPMRFLGAWGDLADGMLSAATILALISKDPFLYLTYRDLIYNSDDPWLQRIADRLRLGEEPCSRTPGAATQRPSRKRSRGGRTSRGE